MCYLCDRNMVENNKMTSSQQSRNLKNYVFSVILEEEDPLLTIFGISPLLSVGYSALASLESLAVSLRTLGTVLAKGSVRIFTPRVLAKFDPKYNKIFAEDEKMKLEIYRKYESLFNRIDLMNYPDAIGLAFLMNPGAVLGAGLLSKGLIGSLMMANTLVGHNTKLQGYISKLQQRTTIRSHGGGHGGGGGHDVGYNDYQGNDYGDYSASAFGDARTYPSSIDRLFEAPTPPAQPVPQTQPAVQTQQPNSQNLQKLFTYTVSEINKNPQIQAVQKDALMLLQTRVNKMVAAAKEYDNVKTVDQIKQLFPDAVGQVDQLINQFVGEYQKELDKAFEKEKDDSKKQQIKSMMDSSKQGLAKIKDPNVKQDIETKIINFGFKKSIEEYKKLWIKKINEIKNDPQFKRFAPVQAMKILDTGLQSIGSNQSTPAATTTST